MSSRQTVEEVQRSLEVSRGELESALADLRVSAGRASDIRGHAQRYSADLRGRLKSDSPGLVMGAVASGFVVGGGVSGTVHMPFKFLRVLLGRPWSRSRLEAAMRQDRYSKQVGRALAGVAAADRHMRSPRARLWRLIRPSPRRLFLLGSAGGGLFMAMADDETRQTVQTEARALAETLGNEVSKRIEQSGH
ncbi:MAG: hypothetical protein ACR2NR_02810 [Solirubrobacteraceae bacterium]